MPVYYGVGTLSKCHVSVSIICLDIISCPELQFYVARFIFTMHLYCTNSKQVDTLKRDVYTSRYNILAYISTHKEHGKNT